MPSDTVTVDGLVENISSISFHWFTDLNKEIKPGNIIDSQAVAWFLLDETGAKTC